MATIHPENGKRLLFELADALDACGIPFFLMQGTALGAVRDGGFTPTERDIDLGMLSEHFIGEPCERLIRHLEAAGFDLHLIDRPFRCIRTIVAFKYGEHADLVSFAIWKGWRFASAPADPVARGPRPYCIVHERSLLETYQPVELFGRQFHVPSPVELYLEREYGPDWRTPREDHLSRTRQYEFIEREGIPDGWLGA